MRCRIDDSVQHFPRDFFFLISILHIKWYGAVTPSDLQRWVWSEPSVALILVHWLKDGSRLDESSFTPTVCVSWGSPPQRGGSFTCMWITSSLVITWSGIQPQDSEMDLACSYSTSCCLKWTSQICCTHCCTVMALQLHSPSSTLPVNSAVWGLLLLFSSGGHTCIRLTHYIFTWSQVILRANRCI